MRFDPAVLATGSQYIAAVGSRQVAQPDARGSSFLRGLRTPADDLRLQFEALARLDEREREIAREPLEGMLIKHDAEQWMRSKQAAGAE